jgi:hypothetical protein
MALRKVSITRPVLIVDGFVGAAEPRGMGQLACSAGFYKLRESFYVFVP